MKSKKNISRIFLIHMTLVALIAISILGYLWLDQEFRRFESETENIRTTYLAQYKNRIKDEVERVIDYIRYKQSQASARLKQDIQARTESAHAIAMSIHSSKLKGMSQPAREKVIVETLRAIRYNNGRGYFFATRLDGVEMLFADRPELEGENLIHVQDTDGKFVIQDMIHIAETKGEGFYRYSWTKPNQTGRNFPKIAFIKKLEPYRWFIGTGEYLDDVEADIQKEVIDRIEKITFEKDGYIFAGTWEGISLSGPAKGKNMMHIEDAQGVKIVQRLIEKARAGGGYLQYVMPRFKGHRPLPKLSYAASIPEWEWYIGTGIYIDDIEEAVKKEKDLMEIRVRMNAIRLFGIFAGLSVFIYMAARRISNKTRSAFEQFAVFFRSAENSTVEINTSDLGFHEFEAIAVSANRMITKIRNANQRTVQLQSLLQDMIDSMPSALVGVNLNQEVTHWNREAERLTGIGPEQAKGRLLSEVLPQIRIDMVEEAIHRKEVVKHGKAAWVFTEGNGFADITVYPLRTEGVEGAVIRIDDISEKVRTEEMVIQSEKMLTVGGLAAGMAHEINNPLAGIVQNVQVIEGRLTADLPGNRQAAEKIGVPLEAVQGYAEARGVIGMIKSAKDSAVRASQIVKNMLSFSRKGGEMFAPEDLRELVDHTLELLGSDYDMKHHYDFKKFSIIKEYSAGLPRVECERSKIQQVLLNILKNAAHAMAGRTSAPSIILRIYNSEDKNYIEIEDNGPGIDENVRSRIFEPFFTTKSNKGTGLGLSIAYFIITENHGGTLEVSSAPGKGTCFTVGLPVFAEYS